MGVNFEGSANADSAKPAKPTVAARPVVKPVAKPKAISKDELPEDAIVVNPQKQSGQKVYRRVPTKKLLFKVWVSTGVAYFFGFIGVFCLFAIPILSVVFGVLACYMFTVSGRFFRRAEMKSGLVRAPIVFMGMVALIGGTFMMPTWFKAMTDSAGEPEVRYTGFFRIGAQYAKMAAGRFGEFFRKVVVPILPE